MYIYWQSTQQIFLFTSASTELSTCVTLLQHSNLERQHFQNVLPFFLEQSIVKLISIVLIIRFLMFSYTSAVL